MKYHLIFVRKLGKMSQNFSSAAVVVGALRVNHSFAWRYQSSYWSFITSWDSGF